MRGVAALLVVVHHTAWKVHVYSDGTLDWWNAGRAGVDLFFIISGYIMCHVTYERKIDVKTFLLARIRRIAPLYWTLTTLALLVFIVMPEKINSSGGQTNILYSYALWPTKDKYLIQNGWTLTFEFYFYFIFSFSLLLQTVQRYFLSVAIILILTLSGYFIESKSTANSIQDVATGPLILEFILGVLIFHWRKKIIGRPVFGIFMIIVATISLFFINQTDWWYSRVISYGIPAMMLFIGMLALEPWFRDRKKNKLSKLALELGNSSYSLYLSHPFTLVFGAIALSYFGINKMGGIFAISLILVSVISGYLCFFLIEKNLNRIFISITRATKETNNIK